MRYAAPLWVHDSLPYVLSLLRRRHLVIAHTPLSPEQPLSEVSRAFFRSEDIRWHAAFPSRRTVSRLPPMAHGRAGHQRTCPIYVFCSRVGLFRWDLARGSIQRTFSAMTVAVQPTGRSHGIPGMVSERLKFRVCGASYRSGHDSHRENSPILESSPVKRRRPA